MNVFRLSVLLLFVQLHPETYASATTDTLRLDLTEGVILELAEVPAGTFLFGTDDGEDDEKPQHTKRIDSPFYIGIYEVTQEQWEAVMNSNPSRIRGFNLPVNMVDWFDCHLFLTALNQRFSQLHFRLPTEAEWEYVCKSGGSRTYQWGNHPEEIDSHAWTSGSPDAALHAVGQKKPGPWGVYDLHGNVWEWTETVYAEGHDAGAVLYEELQVIKGGGWRGSAEDCRCSNRGAAGREGGSMFIGLRIVAEMKERNGE